MRAIRLPVHDADARKIGLGVLLGALYLFSLVASLSLSAPTRAAPFWPCNALIAIAVVVLERRVFWVFLAICTLSTAPLMVSHIGLDLGLFRGFFNIGEGIGCGVLARIVLGPRRLLRTAVGFLRLQLLAVVPGVLLGAFVRQAALRLTGNTSAMTSWRASLLPHILGMAMILPAMLLLLQPTPSDSKRRHGESIVLLGATALITHLVFNQAQLPVAFFVSPMLLLAAFRLGPRGAVVGTLIVGLVCLPATVSGGGSFALHPQWMLADRALIYQGVFLSSLFGVALCSFMVDEQARLRRLLERRAAAARDARVRALAASRAKTEFLATMSHEIRTPMNSILGFTQLLMADAGVSDEARARVKVISDAGGSLMTVLNDILDFSKVEAGQIELHLEPVDASAAASAAVEIMRGPARTKGLAVRLEAEDLPGHVFADGQRLRQVLLNLLNNAVKFTHEGHVLLRATHQADRGVLRFEVSDTGIGIDEEAMSRLFSRFSQADSSTTRRYGGTGLGLAICKGLIERMGGVIGVESRPGTGSTFWFEIPAHVAEPGLLAAECAQTPAAPVGGRVLLVDDHPMNRLLGETLLGMMGCQVDLATSGEEAVQAAGAQGYDLILMDVHMPGMDGLAATRAIKALFPAGEGPRVIAMSADVMPQNLERCRQAGMVDYIAKPVQMAQMQVVLQRWMAEQKQRSAA